MYSVHETYTSEESLQVPVYEANVTEPQWYVGMSLQSPTKAIITPINAGSDPIYYLLLNVFKMN